MGPATHAATAGLFDWGPTEEVTTVPGAKPLWLATSSDPRRGQQDRPVVEAWPDACLLWGESGN